MKDARADFFRTNLKVLLLCAALVLAGCAPVISTENAEDLAWLKTYPIAAKKSWGDTAWQHNNDGKFFVSGFVQNLDGTISGFAYEWDVRNENGTKYDWLSMDGQYFPGTPITCLAVSPDEKRIALGTLVGPVILWNVNASNSAEDVYYLEGHTEAVKAVAWSPDGKLIASGGYDNTVRVWNVSQEVHSGVEPLQETLRLDTNYKVQSISFAPEGEILIFGTEGGVAAIDLATNEVILDVSGKPLAQLGHSLTWSPDKTTMAAGSFDGKVFFFTFEEGRFSQNVDLIEVSKSGSILALDYSPDATMLVLAYPNMIHVWDLETAKTIKRFSAGEDLFFSSVSWSPDGRYIAVTYSDGTLRIIGIE